MNSIRVGELKPGRIFSHPVYIEDDIVLVLAGIAIREKDLERLRTWKIQSVETEGALQNATETLMPPENTWGFPVDDESFSYYTKSINRIDGIFARIGRMGRVSKHEIEVIVFSITDTVKANQKVAIRLMLVGITTQKTYAKGALDSGILSLIIGLRLGKTKDELFQLYCAALLHDVGMQRILFDSTELNRALSVREEKSLRTHPIYSYKIVQEELQLPETIAQLVLQHHERWDDGGYPWGLKAADILFGLRIIAVVDAFVAMISERLWRKSMIGYEAVKVILGDNQRKFDSEIVSLIIRILGIYPIGSLIQLSDANENTPLRPKVLILIDRVGIKFPDETSPTIDLHDEKSLFITRVADLSSSL